MTWQMMWEVYYVGYGVTITVQTGSHSAGEYRRCAAFGCVASGLLTPAGEWVHRTSRAHIPLSPTELIVAASFTHVFGVGGAIPQ